MKQLDPNMIFIGRPASRKTEFTSLGTWLCKLGLNIGRHYPEVSLVISEIHETRLVLMRNLIVQMAKEAQCGKILMVDPDAFPDTYVKLTGVDPQGRPVYADRFRPFFDAAWSFMQANRREMGPMVLAAPARGCSPDNDVQVFFRTTDGRMIKISNDEAKKQIGWHRVGAVGTHLMLIDTEVFSRLEHPYFEDVYRDNTHTKLWKGQDVMFCRKCNEQDMPVIVNFDCWSAHWQDECVQMPGMEKERRQPSPAVAPSQQAPPQPTPNTEPSYTVE